MVARVARAQLHAQYSWTCRDVWPGKNSWYWMAREQAWPPAEHSPSDPAPFVTTQADIVPSVASGGNVKVMLSMRIREKNERAWLDCTVWCHFVDCRQRESSLDQS